MATPPRVPDRARLGMDPKLLSVHEQGEIIRAWLRFYGIRSVAFGFCVAAVWRYGGGMLAALDYIEECHEFARPEPKG